MSDKKSNLMLDRRALLQLVGAVGVGVYLRPFDEAKAQSGNPGSKKFLLYIHAGSWDGWAAGLLQPQDMNQFVKGIFNPGQVGMPSNPNLAAHFKSRNLIFHEYSKVLASISDHLFLGMGNSESAGHETARKIRSSGTNRTGVSATPGWPYALAQATMGTKPVDFVCGSGYLATAGSTATSKVLTFSAAAPSQVGPIFSDVAALKDKPGSSEWAELTARLFGTDVGPAHFTKEELSAGSEGVRRLAAGVPNLNAIITNLNSDFTLAKTEQLLQSAGLVDFDGTKAETALNRAATLDNFKLAALLIETGLASGMQMTLPLQDYHGGGAEVFTARSGANLWAQLVLFWNWIKAKGLQDDVMVIVSHEFSRTAYNATIPATGRLVKVKQGNSIVDVDVKCPGKDHQLAFGMYFLNGKVPGGSRIGGIGDFYTPAPTDGLNGKLMPNLPPYSAQQLVCSMLLRVWPEIFESQRFIRQFYPGFREEDIIKSLLA